MIEKELNELIFVTKWKYLYSLKASTLLSGSNATISILPHLISIARNRPTPFFGEKLAAQYADGGKSGI